MLYSIVGHAAIHILRHDHEEDKHINHAGLLSTHNFHSDLYGYAKSYGMFLRTYADYIPYRLPKIKINECDFYNSL